MGTIEKWAGSKQGLEKIRRGLSPFLFNTLLVAHQLFQLSSLTKNLEQATKIPANLPVLQLSNAIKICHFKSKYSDFSRVIVIYQCDNSHKVESWKHFITV